MKNQNRKPLLVSGRLRVDAWESRGQKGLRRLKVSMDTQFIGKAAQKDAGEKTSPSRPSDEASSSRA